MVDSDARSEFVLRVEQRSYALVFALHFFVAVSSLIYVTIVGA